MIATTITLFFLTTIAGAVMLANRSVTWLIAPLAALHLVVATLWLWSGRHVIDVIAALPEGATAVALAFSFVFERGQPPHRRLAIACFVVALCCSGFLVLLFAVPRIG